MTLEKFCFQIQTWEKLSHFLMGTTSQKNVPLNQNTKCIYLLKTPCGAKIVINYINFYNCQCFDDRLLNEDFEIGRTHLITIDCVIEEDDIKDIDVQG